MAEFLIFAIVSGSLFAVWPIFMGFNKIPNASMASVVMEAIVLITLLPFGLQSWGKDDFATASWKFLFLAAVSAGLGVLSFNWGLTKTDKGTLSTYIVLVIVVQVTVTALYQVLIGGITKDKFYGFVLATFAAYFLSK